MEPRGSATTLIVGLPLLAEQNAVTASHVQHCFLATLTVIICLQALRLLFFIPLRFPDLGRVLRALRCVCLWEPDATAVASLLALAREHS